jgi:hypothetical protein
MIAQRSLLLVLFSACAISVDSFGISNPASTVATLRQSTFVPFVQTSTCLRAEEESEAEAIDTEKVEVIGDDSASAATDILNSPVFLQKKLDVLKSDVAKIDEDIEEVKTVVEAGRAEWGEQLANLQKEVSVFF